jgi:hypothetical protein
LRYASPVMAPTTMSSRCYPSFIDCVCFLLMPDQFEIT